jgi:hemerythrin
MGSFIGVDVGGVQTWKGQLDNAHEQIIAALNHYRAIAQQNDVVAHGSHFQNLNAQCEEITNRHLADHNQLHAQYTKDTTSLVQSIQEIAGG